MHAPGSSSRMKQQPEQNFLCARAAPTAQVGTGGRDHSKQVVQSEIFSVISRTST